MRSSSAGCLAFLALMGAGCVCMQHAIDRPERRATECDVLTPGDHMCRIEIPQGPGEPVARTFLVHVPPSLGKDPVPLVLAFHGIGSNAMQMAHISDLSEKADQARFLAVYPQGLGPVPGWNTRVIGEAKPLVGVGDDVEFVRQIVLMMKRLARIDPRRIYVTGMSNGGFLAHKLACEMSDVIAAIGPVAALNAEEACPAGRPVPVLAFNGANDAVVLFRGAPAIGVPSARQSIADWAARDGCEKESKEIETKGEVRCEAWPGCAGGAEVILCVVENGGHTWPGGNVPSYVGHTTQDADATDLLWKFFERHPMPETPAKAKKGSQS